MSKPKRNDPCPCGSGKKFKKCCGKNNVIEFNPALYNNELEQLNAGLLEYAITNFESELETFSLQYTDAYMGESSNEELDTYLSILMGWMIFYKPIKSGNTIFDMYHAEQQNKINHPRTKKVFSSWNHAKPGVFKIVAVEDQPVPRVTLKNLSTNKKYNYLSEDETGIAIGDLMVGTIIPYVNTYDSIFGMVQIMEEQEIHILDLLNEMESNNEKIENVFPRLLAEIIHPQENISLEWIDPRHEMVAELFADRMLKKDIDEELIVAGVVLWNVYCLRNNPIIKKLGTYAATLEYIVQINFVEDSTITQAQLAKEYDTSAGTISTNYRKLTEDMEEELRNHPFATDDIQDASIEPSFLSDPSNIGTFSMEKEMRDIEKVLSNEDFDSPEEATNYLNNILQDGDIPAVSQEPRDIAQDIIHQARNKQGKEKKKLIEKALNIYPNSPDAYLLLAEDAKSPIEQQQLLKYAVTVGENDLGEEFFKENKGHFWGLIETRPYMRAKASYAMALEDTNFDEDAIKHFEELLELNPNDNQGIRDQLLPLYIFTEDFNKAKKLLQTYENDTTATFLFNKALVVFLTEGMTHQAITLLEEAHERNEYVMDYLLGLKKIPNVTYQQIQLGDETEAITYAQNNTHLWADAEDFLEAFLSTE